MQQPVVHHNRIKALGREWQVLGVPNAELDGWVEPLRDLDHRGGNVDTRDFAGTIGQVTATSNPEWRGTILTSYGWNNLSANVTNRYISAMDHGNTVTGGSPLTNTGVEAIWYTDIGAEYKLPNNIKLRAGINNVSNQQPRLYTPNVQANTDPSLYDVLGRTFFVGVGWEI
jgi:outer membrane receptor protein involved in Fe transport